MYPLLPPDDRGPAKYFHGRKGILNKFVTTLGRADAIKGGTIFVIQAPPGAGKTALLAECRKRAGVNGWGTAEIEPEALWWEDALRKCLEKGRNWRGMGFDIGGKGGETGVVPDFQKDAISPREMLEGGSRPLLLLLDEAQRLGSTARPPDSHLPYVTSLLHGIHNGKLGRPLVLVVAGLGMTVQVLESLEISRITGKGLVELEALRKEEEQGVVRDWLVKEGKAKGNVPEWIGAITAETYGWPQHIMSYMDPVIRHLDENGKTLTAEGLQKVLRDGRELRDAYYERRANNFEEDECQSLSNLMAEIPPDGGLGAKEILSRIPEGLFHRALQKGVLYRHQRVYGVPIPTLRGWFAEHYPPERDGERGP